MNNHRHLSPDEYAGWSCDQVREELEAWSLHALEPAEMAAVDRHLAHCEDCREEADSLAHVAAMLPFSVQAVSPSPEVMHTLMSRIADDQMATGIPTRSQSPLSSGPAPAPAESDTGGRRFHWSQMLIAPLAIALLVMSVWAFELQGQVNESDDETSLTVPAAMLPEGFQTFSMQSDCEACASTGKLLADPAKADALMVAWDLDPGEVHEVWCEERDGERVLVANLNVSETGDVVQPLVFDQPIAGYSKIYVTNADGETVEIRMDPPDGSIASPSIT